MTVERVYPPVKADPEFRFGFHPQGALSMEVKRFFVEKYEEYTGERLLEDSEARVRSHSGSSSYKMNHVVLLFPS